MKRLVENWCFEYFIHVEMCCIRPLKTYPENLLSRPTDNEPLPKQEHIATHLKSFLFHHLLYQCSIFRSSLLLS